VDLFSQSHVSYVDLINNDHVGIDDLSENEYVPLTLSMKNQIQREKCIILADNPRKLKWDIWLIFVLFWVAFTLPYRIAFADDDNLTWNIINYFVDGCFLLDMFLTFFTAILDTETNGLITDKRKIALNYLKGWFIIDLISILPFDKIAAVGVNSESTNADDFL